ncbi:actin-like protein arp8 [Kickxella alabastrina]|uniref:Actin-like protein arp8 n=1 Tax=Kickxella alabastrina TaxID=61397 RepID=A0ACC1IU90_9FUNG|nr:actin-like protein arp8 [Kickxella alabastrina]
MSGFNAKRKKYSWLPETNPAALSGDPGSTTSTPKTDTSDKSSKPTKSRTKAKATKKDKLDPNTNTDININTNTNTTAIDGLGIVTTMEVAGEQPEATAGSSSTTTNKPIAKARRRSRKDSVDELVRSRLQSTMAAQQELPQGGALRKTQEAPTPGSITASVRDALASERSAARMSPSIAMSISASTATSAATTTTTAAATPKQRGGRHARQDTVPGTPLNSKTSAVPRPASPPVRLDSIESKYSFPSYTQLNHRNVTSSMRRGDRGVGAAETARGVNVPTGENVIVVHPGSRWLRIGRASDPVPKEIPHVIARRLRTPLTRPPPPPPPQKQQQPQPQPQTSPQPKLQQQPQPTEDSAADPDNMDVDSGPNEAEVTKPSEPTAMDVEGNEEGNSSGEDSDTDGAKRSLVDMDAVDQTVEMLREALKQHQRHSKRKVPPNVYSQVLTYNENSRPEVIQDHNDPFKTEWVQDSEIKGDQVIGERVLRIADPDKFIIRHPLRNGSFNIQDYASVEDILGDIESIWTGALEAELGIGRREFSKYAVVLVIPDVFSRVEVAALSDVLLRRMGFQHLLVQQSSTLVTFGAGISTACVVDVGAQKTSIACVEDGYCYQESRVNIMYGGDDITRFLFRLFQSSSFPYADASLACMSDWLMLNYLREKQCTMNLSDVNIRLRDLYVRQPNEHTCKYSFKTYDEAYQAPLCLFYPAVADALGVLPDYEKSFVAAQRPDYLAESQPRGCPYLTPTQFGALPVRAVETATNTDDQTSSLQSAALASTESATEPATAPATMPTTAPGTPDLRPQTDTTTAIASDIKEILSTTLSSTPSAPAISYVADQEPQFSRMPLDLAVTHSIAHSGSHDRARKMYASVLIVEVVSAPRDLDPRVLAWKGGAVLSRLECANEMWVSRQEWIDFGTRLLRERVLFQW